MITIMNANAITPSWAIENATPAERAITPVAAAVPGPHTTNAAVPTNSAATFRENDASALDAIGRPHPAFRRAPGVLRQRAGRAAYRLGEALQSIGRQQPFDGAHDSDRADHAPRGAEHRRRDRGLAQG